MHREKSIISWENKEVPLSKGLKSSPLTLKKKKKKETVIPPFSDNENKCLLIAPYLDKLAYLGDVVTCSVSRASLFAEVKIAFEQPLWTLLPSSIM